MIACLIVASLGAAGTASAEETAIGTAVIEGDPGISDAEAAKAERFIRTKHKKVRAVLRKPDTPKRADELTVLLGEFLDYDRLTRLSLDKEWNRRSPPARDSTASPSFASSWSGSTNATWSRRSSTE